MLTRTIGVAAFVCLSAGAGAVAASPPAVESMSCAEMSTELTAAGQKMASQMDPEFAKEAQAMADEARGAGPGAADIGMAATCAIPGLGMLCMIGQQAQTAGAGEKTEENLQRMQAQMERLQKAMEGLDQERLMALSQRFQEKKCEIPQ